jgi:hypothetical protein
LLIKTPHDHAFQCRRRLRIVAQHRSHALERATPGEHFVQHGPETEYVGSRVAGFALDLFRRQAEVEQLHAFLGHQNIGRLQVPMQDSLGARLLLEAVAVSSV